MGYARISPCWQWSFALPYDEACHRGWLKATLQLCRNNHRQGKMLTSNIFLPSFFNHLDRFIWKLNLISLLFLSKCTIVRFSFGKWGGGFNKYDEPSSRYNSHVDFIHGKEKVEIVFDAA
jgi:hypothetical protein